MLIYTTAVDGLTAAVSIGDIILLNNSYVLISQRKQGRNKEASKFLILFKNSRNIIRNVFDKKKQLVSSYRCCDSCR